MQKWAGHKQDHKLPNRNILELFSLDYRIDRIEFIDQS